MNVGDKVTYVPSIGPKEIGVVKTIHPDGNKAWVVYKCDGNWEHYQNYTGALTSFSDLKPGWTQRLI